MKPWSHDGIFLHTSVVTDHVYSKILENSCSVHLWNQNTFNVTAYTLCGFERLNLWMIGLCFITIALQWIIHNMIQKAGRNWNYLQYIKIAFFIEKVLEFFPSYSGWWHCCDLILDEMLQTCLMNHILLWDEENKTILHQFYPVSICAWMEINDANT